jgi:hypothetical protein
MREIEVGGSISDITGCLQEHASEFKNNWFRGHSDYNNKLLPSIFRQGHAYSVSLNEQKMFDEFRRRYPEEASAHKNTYEWLTLMQHYGLPTRLLDWSSNLLVSFYFCCSSDLSVDGALYIFDPTLMERDFCFNELLEMQIQEKSRSDFYRRIIYKMSDYFNDATLLNGVSLHDIKSNIMTKSRFCGLSTGSCEDFVGIVVRTDLSDTIDHGGNQFPLMFQDVIREFSSIVPFRSPHLNPRIRQQQGCFTFHGGMYIDGKEFIRVEPMEQHAYCQNSLLKLKISAADKPKLLMELDYVGIREATLFPEMEYQANEIRRLFTGKVCL